MQFIKIFLLLFFCLSCNKKESLKNIYTHKTQKIQIQKKWKSDHKLSYLWSKPEGPKNHQPKWIVNDDIMLFTPYEPGYYSIAVSIENSMGKFLGQEIFNYNVINKKKNLVSLNNGVLKKRKKNTLKKKEIKTNFYTIQVSSWNKIEDAEKEMAKLNRLGYKSYIDKKK